MIRNHRRAAHGERAGYENLATPPVPLDHAALRTATGNYPALIDHAAQAWDRALALGTEHGFRNAQTTVVAPTGTIGLVMDCDTTGIEPDFALVKFKKLAGGGYFKIINRAVPEALRVLGYTKAQIAEIEAYAVGHGALANAPAINHTTLKAKGFTPEAITRSRTRCRPPSTSASPSTSGRWARIFVTTPSASRRRNWRGRISTCWPSSASPSARSRPPTCMCAAP